VSLQAELDEMAEEWGNTSRMLDRQAGELKASQGEAASARAGNAELERAVAASKVNPLFRPHFNFSFSLLLSSLELSDSKVYEP